MKKKTFLNTNKKDKINETRERMENKGYVDSLFIELKIEMFINNSVHIIII